MDPNRKLWNQQQQALRTALGQPRGHQRAIKLFLSQHAMMHTAKMSEAGLWSMEDEIWDGLTEPAARSIPAEFGHSIVWCFWHLTRIEDVTMNMLLAGTPQLFLRDSWIEQLKIPYRDTGNGMDSVDVAKLSASIDIAALLAYRLSVGQRTREIVMNISREALKDKVDPARLRRVTIEGAVTEAGREVIEYWGGLTGAGLLLMPPTRHSLLHLNECLRIKQAYLKI
jgi:hypothetical protein